MREKMEYNQVADCLYIPLSVNQQASVMTGTVKLSNAPHKFTSMWGTAESTDVFMNTIFDLGSNGEILGIEIMNASRFYPKEFLDLVDIGETLKSLGYE